jgi:LmbE family N-acetylglucosaminyl deacetylase
MKAVILVAHPDDETIWSGGLILQHPDWDWTVMSLCRADDPDRAPRFKKVCRIYGAKAIITNLDDSSTLQPIDPRTDIGRRIVESIGDTSWELCVTHGRNGEYGHLRHREIHAEVLRLVTEDRLRCRKLWTFAYDCDSEASRCFAAPWGEKRIELTTEQLAEKKRIIYEEYGYGNDSFEVKACISPESFHQVEGRGKERKR